MTARGVRGLSLTERLKVARLGYDQARRARAAAMMASPLMRWRYGAPKADQLIILPHDLRTCEPSFADELASGQLGLAGFAADLQGGSPFDLKPPSDDWARELHGFSWLRHLRAAGSTEASAMAQELVAMWIKQARDGGAPIAREPAVLGRRLMSWIANAQMLLDGIDQKAYDRTTDALGDQIIKLSGTWRDAQPGYPRLQALTALVMADVCIAGHEAHLFQILEPFGEELDRQILPDGGHISRNPAVAVEIILDLLPLRRCFESRNRRPPDVINKVIERAMPTLRMMRLGDGGLARFNGGGLGGLDSLVTALTYNRAEPQPQIEAPQTRYARLERGEMIVLVDVGGPPPLEFAARAHAGALAFEMSYGEELVLVNSGAPGPADLDQLSLARATASHNTLALDGTSSAKLVRHEAMTRFLGGEPVSGEGRVLSKLEERASGVELSCSHEGYLARTGLVHRRRLALENSGRTLIGLDRLGPVKGDLRLARDLPFAIHFHLHPHVKCEANAARDAILITTQSGQRFRFTAPGAHASIEPGRHCSYFSGPRASLQIVIRGACHGDTRVSWRLEADGDHATTDDESGRADWDDV